MQQQTSYHPFHGIWNLVFQDLISGLYPIDDGPAGPDDSIVTAAQPNATEFTPDFAIVKEHVVMRPMCTVTIDHLPFTSWDNIAFIVPFIAELKHPLSRRSPSLELFVQELDTLFEQAYQDLESEIYRDPHRTINSPTPQMSTSAPWPSIKARREWVVWSKWDWAWVGAVDASSQSMINHWWWSSRRHMILGQRRSLWQTGGSRWRTCSNSAMVHRNSGVYLPPVLPVHIPGHLKARLQFLVEGQE